MRFKGHLFHKRDIGVGHHAAPHSLLSWFPVVTTWAGLAKTWWVFWKHQRGAPPQLRVVGVTEVSQPRQLERLPCGPGPLKPAGAGGQPQYLELTQEPANAPETMDTNRPGPQSKRKLQKSK